MYNIYSIYTDALCVDTVMLDVCSCMLLSTHCMSFYRVIVCTVMFDIYVGCMWIVTVCRCNTDNAQCL